LARYSLIIKNLVFTALVQFGANQNPPKTFGKLVNEILTEYAEAHTDVELNITRQCFTCVDYLSDRCENALSPHYKKRPPFKKGCVKYEKRN